MKRLLIIAGLVLSAAVGYGQTQPQQGKDSPGNAEQNAPPLTGKSTISGVVMNGKTHEPVKKAKVVINGATSLSAVTDAGGNFSFRALPAGMYWIMANHPDFSAGVRRAQMAVNVNLTDGEEKTGVEIALQPGASIGGKVVNEDDQAVPNCSVTASRAGTRQSRQGFGYSVSGSTDSDGNYSIHGIEPGRYTVEARCGQSFPAPHGFMRPNDPDIPTEGYAAVSYAGGGGTAAGGLLVAAGVELAGIDFHVQRSRMFSVRAGVSGVESTLLPVTQVLMLSRKDGQSDEGVGMPARYNGGRGLFVFRNVAPGSYEVVATLVQADKAFEARQDIQVGKSQVTDVELKMAPGPSISGAVVADDAGVQLEGQQISLQPLQPNYRGPFPVSVLTKDGTFEFKSVLPGHFSLNGLQGGYFKSVTLGGREVTPSDIEISGEGGVLHISLSSRFGRVHVNAESQPAAGEQVGAVLFPVGGGQPLVASFGGGGTVDVEFSQVAPGKYRVLLMAADNPWMIANDPVAEKVLEDHTTQVTVAEASDQRVTATLIGKEELGKLLEATE
jgi:hypothetical protein